MTMDADQIVDRRRLRRKLTFWRVAAFLLLALAIVGALLYASGDSLTTPQIARVSVSGFIAEDRDQLKMLDRLANADAVKAVLVSIDSTGGSTAGGESLYEALRRLAAKKPVVATIGTVGFDLLGRLWDYSPALTIAVLALVVAAIVAYVVVQARRRPQVLAGE